jgi:DNA invertase Pin-like site-specific DNA recombinase
MSKIKSCAIYIRVSTFEQGIHGKSLESQEEHLRRYAEEHGMKVYDVYADVGQTARKELKKRKAIFRLLDDVKAGYIDTILFWRMDRWFRSVSDFYKVQDILDKYNVNWISTSEPNITLETRDGRLNLNLVLAIGQNEVDTTSERIRFVNEMSIKSGRVIFGETNVGYGFQIREVDGMKRIVKNEEEAPIVEEYYRVLLQTGGKFTAASYIRDTYGVTLTASNINTLCTSEFYKGSYRNNKNYCPAYLTEEQWDRIQEINARNKRNTSRSGRVYFFSSLIRCPVCGNKMGGCGIRQISNHKTKVKKDYEYYRCTRAFVNHTCTFRKRTSQISIEKFLTSHILEKYERLYLTCGQKETARRKPKRNQMAKLETELRNLNYMFQKDRISLAEYDEAYEKVQEKIVKYKSQEKNDLPPRPSVTLDSDILELYYTFDKNEKRDFWQSVIKEIRIDMEGHPVDFDFL